MSELNSKNIRVFANFLSRLAKEMTRFYYLKLNKPFKAINKQFFWIFLVSVDTPEDL